MRIKLLMILITAAFFGLIWAVFSNAQIFSNTFEVRYLLVRSLLAGFVISGIGAYFAAKSSPEAFDRIRIWAVLLIFGGFFFTLLGVYSNFTFTRSKGTDTIKATFLKDEPIIVNRFLTQDGRLNVDAYYSYFSTPSTTFRLRSKNQMFKNIEPNTAIEIPVRIGFWGFEIADVE